MKILLIDNYDSFTYNLYHYISNFKKDVQVIRNDKIDGKTILRKRYDKIVISPGPGNPNQAGNCLKIVKEVHKKISIKTRQYAKRQSTWARGQMSSWNKINSKDLKKFLKKI